MAIWIRTVDPHWFAFVSARPSMTEINLWTPGARRVLDGAATGDLVLFRVKGQGGIAGCGLFFQAAIYFAEDAWAIFGEGNGAVSRETFWNEVRARHTARDMELYALGCHDIVEPSYLNPFQSRVPEPALRRIGSGPIDEDSADGELLLQFLDDAKAASSNAMAEGPSTLRDREKRRNVFPGRSGFRVAVHKAYRRTCAITGETVLPSLEAVHFIADQFNGALEVRNATLLRRDFHPLLEQGYMTISADYRVLFSTWLPKAFPQCQAYLAYHGKPLLLPDDQNLWPDSDLLARHRAFPFFKGPVIARLAP